jgi:hypothetical protein
MDCEHRPPQAFHSNQVGQLWRSTFTGRTRPCSSKRLAESHSDAERQMLLKLLADEKAKEPPPKMGNLKPR